ncbi:hypothetical protein [Spiroplasma sp. SV19]|uniref:hypothetical protein n=1 Tax=Spiroplasma sp. SV19 TaxID=2570468 RepID=UPI0024B85F46|nr:hypothetical protein [Spiroplasma sp. SV19]WHQ36737.1 hypothetical protein E7Y35_02355 [Spiroplasma sp. SV19]
MQFASKYILQNLGLSNSEIDHNNVTMIAGTVKLQLKNKNDQWEDFKTITMFKEVDKTDKDGKPVTDKEGNPVKVKVGPDLNQILNATDIKFSFMNVKFKVTLKNNDKFIYEPNSNINFDLWLSDDIN